MKLLNRKFCSHSARAFTLVEVIMVVVIMAIAALLAIPMISSGADFQLRAAANIIAADLEYAKSLAITKQDNYSIIFDADNESYEMHDSNGDVVDDPVRASGGIAVDFANDSRFSQVDIETVSFDSTDTVIFDYLGVPYNGSSNPLSSSAIVLKAGDHTITVTVAPVTGYVTIE
jgi:prepilin-type N-terminal cleavage/methylation domain-containing protein